LALCLCFLRQPFRTAGDTPAPNAEVVSLVRLITASEQYDGKAVLVVGFLRLEFGGNGLYLHEENYEHSITKNAVGVVRNAKINERADALNMHYVMLGGTFDANHNGHMGLFSGSLRTSVPDCSPKHRCSPIGVRWTERAAADTLLAFRLF
jgi:hypothetical protein